jgi:hypothetical protein
MIPLSSFSVVVVLLAVLAPFSCAGGQATSLQLSSRLSSSSSSSSSSALLRPPLPYVLTPLPSSSFSIHVPSTMGVSLPLLPSERTRVVHGMARMLSELAGGCTATEAVGFFVASNGQLVQERVTVLQSYMDLSTADVRDELHQMAAFLCRALQQESVLINMDGQPLLVASRPKGNSLIRAWSEQDNAGAVEAGTNSTTSCV